MFCHVFLPTLSLNLFSKRHCYIYTHTSILFAVSYWQPIINTRVIFGYHFHQAPVHASRGGELDGYGFGS